MDATGRTRSEDAELNGPGRRHGPRPHGQTAHRAIGIREKPDGSFPPLCPPSGAQTPAKYTDDEMQLT